jgi:hypothetical protein
VQKPRFIVTLACALVALVVAAPAGAEIVVGAADNRPESSPEQAERFYDTMVDVGLTENRLSIVWNPQQPNVIERQTAVDQAVALAAARGIRITFSVYARPSNAISGSAPNGARFVAFLAHLARTYPTVRSFIVGNEPNKPLGWLPQFDARGRAVACSSYAGILAAAYDALKAVDQGITVIGLAAGARGNDNPRARSNASISPVRCIRDIGRAYRASRRTRPLMDELSLHPYPQIMSDSLETGYRWPNAGVPNLARIKQAVWDAFNRTRQPTFAEPGAPLRTLKFRLNEVGWQVAIPPSSLPAYHGQETVAVTDDGHQAAVYGNLIPYLACDASVRSVLFFNMVDEPDLDRWQSGLLRADWTRRPSYNIVRSAIAARTTRCSRRPVVWRHATKVVAAQAKFPDARRPRRERETLWSFTVRADEGAHFAAAIFPATKTGAVPASSRARFTRALRRGGRVKGAVSTARGKFVGRGARLVRFRKQRLKPGRYVFAVRLSAEMNPARSSTFVGRAFQVGQPARPKKKKPARPS